MSSTWDAYDTISSEDVGRLSRVLAIPRMSRIDSKYNHRMPVTTGIATVLI